MMQERLSVTLLLLFITTNFGCSGPNTPGGMFLRSTLSSASKELVDKVENAGRVCGFVSVSNGPRGVGQMEVLANMDSNIGPDLIAKVLLWRDLDRLIVIIDEYDPKAYHKDGSDLTSVARANFNCFEEELQRSLPGVFYRPQPDISY